MWEDSLSQNLKKEAFEENLLLKFLFFLCEYKGQEICNMEIEWFS